MTFRSPSPEIRASSTQASGWAAASGCRSSRRRTLTTAREPIATRRSKAALPTISTKPSTSTGPGISLFGDVVSAPNAATLGAVVKNLFDATDPDGSPLNAVTFGIGGDEEGNAVNEGSGGLLVSNHQYIMLSYNADGFGNITSVNLRNPWGIDGGTDDLRRSGRWTRDHRPHRSVQQRRRLHRGLRAKCDRLRSVSQSNSPAAQPPATSFMPTPTSRSILRAGSAPCSTAGRARAG